MVRTKEEIEARITELRKDMFKSCNNPFPTDAYLSGAINSLLWVIAEDYSGPPPEP